MIIVSDTYIEKPVISVVVITYNQENTIAQTIEAILSQMCTYPFEIIVGDDCSTDETFQICLGYQIKYSNIIKLLSQEYNKGLIKNYIDVLSLCKGRFIAQCAGDDYWCDDKKLQKQCDLLMDNADVGFVRTGNYNLDVKTGKITINNFHSTAVGNVFDIVKYGTIASAPTIFFRTSLLKYINFDQFIKRQFSVEDYPLQAIMAKHTNFAYLSDLTAVYRQAHGTISRPKHRSIQLRYIEGFVAVKCYLSELFPTEFNYDKNMANNTILYKKLQFAFQDFDYINAKKIVPLFIKPDKKELKLTKYTNNIAIFYLACIYKFFIKTLHEA